MREPLAATVPLNEKVWQAWIEKNRRTELEFNTKLRRFGSVVAVSLLAAVMILLARWW
jgi:hypothetical protein